MYRRSDEPRFVKKRDALQRAFIDLTLEKRNTRITVKELAERAGVNRMTFYSHYDEVSDVLSEFVDGLSERIIASCGNTAEMSVNDLLNAATRSMQEEIEFYRLVARDDSFEFYRTSFRKAFATIFAEELRSSSQLEGAELDLTAEMLASAITYAYLDWLGGSYEDISLEDLVRICEGFISTHLD